MSPIQLQGADSAKDRPIQLANAGRTRIKRFMGSSNGTTWLTVAAPISSTWDVQQILVTNFDPATPHTIEARITDTASNVYTLNTSASPVGFTIPVPLQVFTAADQPIHRSHRVIGPGEVLEMRLGEVINALQVSWRIDYFETLNTA